MRAAGKLFEKVPSKKAPATNHEGYAAFDRHPREQLLQTLLTNTCASTYYETKGALIDETERVHTGGLKDPVFMAKALSYARNKGFMRTQPVYGLARLAASPGTEFEQVFSDVIRTPNDLMDFAGIIHSIRNSEGGRRIKRVAGSWLAANLSEYWAIKYGADKSGGYSLRDLFATYHPKTPKSQLVEHLFDRPADFSGLEQMSAFQTLKDAKTDDLKIAAIVAGRLPHEVASSFAGSSKKIWTAIALQMPIFALVRNLATLERYGVLEGDCLKHVVTTLSNRERVSHSKVFPFRFLEAIKHVSNPKVQDALRIALENSFSGADQISGSTAVALDVSGSMASYIEAAAVFAISTVRRAPDSQFSVFNDGLAHFPVSNVDSVLTQAGKIRANGGTDTSTVMKNLLYEKKRVDNIIVVTDEEQNRGAPFMDLVAQYRSKINSQAKVFVLNVAPYTGGSLLDSRDPKNFYVYGLTENALNYISFASRGWGKFVDHVAGVTE